MTWPLPTSPSWTHTTFPLLTNLQPNCSFVCFSNIPRLFHPLGLLHQSYLPPQQTSHHSNFSSAVTSSGDPDHSYLNLLLFGCSQLHYSILQLTFFITHASSDILFFFSHYSPFHILMLSFLGEWRPSWFLNSYFFLFYFFYNSL